MASVTCPKLADLLNETNCLEQFAGLGTNVYLGIKSELTAPLKPTDNLYAAPTFGAGTGLYKVQCIDDKQQIQSTSLGPRAGFKLTANFAHSAVSPESGKISRAINNNDIFLIFEDGENSQILYDPIRRVRCEKDGIKTDTGTTPDSERLTTYEVSLSPVIFPNLYVTKPEGGWDTLLASKKG